MCLRVFVVVRVSLCFAMLLLLLLAHEGRASSFDADAERTVSLRD